MGFSVVKFLDGLVCGQIPGSAVVASPHELPPDWRVEFEERAAILEYDGGLPRWQADEQALQEITEQIRLDKTRKF